MKKYILVGVFEREIGLPQVFDTEEAATEAMVDIVAEILETEPDPILRAIRESGYYDDSGECEVKTTSAWVNTNNGNTDIWIIELDTETWRCS